MNEDADRTERQLALMTEIRLIADRLGIELWLRGGWAMDFFLGEVTRAHKDIDFFAWANDARKLANEVGLRGYAPRAGSHAGQQLDFTKMDEELSFALLADNPQGQVVVAGGPFAGEPWPTGMLSGPVRTLRDVSYRVITPESQIEIKLMMPIWVPGRPRRLKDREDVERIRRALESSELP